MENTPRFAFELLHRLAFQLLHRLAFQLLHRLGRGLLEASFHSEYHMSQNLQCYYSRVSELVLGYECPSNHTDMNVPQTTQSLQDESDTKTLFLHQLKVKTNKINKWLSNSLLQHQKPTISPSIKAQ